MSTGIFDIDPWAVSVRGLDPARVRLVESVMATGNGHMGMRGNFEEGYSGDSHLGTYLAGVWFPDRTRVGWWKNGYPHYFGKVVNAVNFAAVRIAVDGVPVDLATVPCSDFEMRLDMRAGVLTREFRCRVAGVTLRLRFERFLSVVTPELSFQRVEIDVLEGEGVLEVTPLLDGDVHNLDSNYGEQFWAPDPTWGVGASALTFQTVPNPFGTPRFTVTAAMEASLSGLDETSRWRDEWSVGTTWSGPVAPGSAVVLHKTVAVVTSRDREPDVHLATTARLLGDAALQDHSAHRAAQAAAWAERWQLADVEILGDEPAQQGIRFTIFQLLSTYYGEDERLNIGPKGFTGEKYGGATYWDTEAFLFPMYMSIAEPEVAQSLLRYRHRQLPQARHNAAQQGLPGALYPMVTFDGVECHNEWEITFEEIHRNGAIAYAIRHYTEHTGDRSYLEGEGIEVLVEIARFWAGRVHRSSSTGAFMIHGVTGPNEYENNVSNNWYTNYLARWVLRFTSATLSELSDQRRAELAVPLEERERWTEIANEMYLPYDERLGVHVQHDTFLDKALAPVDAIPEGDRPINQHWSWDRILRSCYIKQADVLQGLYLFADDFSQEQISRDFDFYEPMTVHESSLSASLHAVLASSLGRHEKAMELYRRSARLDLDNYNQDTEDGLHITSMSGSWLAIVQGFGGMRVGADGLRFAPFCPQGWQGFGFSVRYRGRVISVQVGPESTEYRLVEGDAVEIRVDADVVRLAVDSVVRHRNVS
ncbi:family 65 glycosyl hydrolase domain-containing protein [Demequina capsici]|uniref:Family 65 glycosyl hydrolase domain-containing protein n=1 Tax=Demequina capsici TaxID=3075620 RepID=A0AA96F7Q6_9MICO|nr:family 65 glycosyl hydrolase domain-containing protein [Demequina sp. OYTSA14]WNM25626.1 family 65 glycosyl hydrolase domain-containing protein [Demequina sp. OYTSA14]